VAEGPRARGSGHSHVMGQGVTYGMSWQNHTAGNGGERRCLAPQGERGRFHMQHHPPSSALRLAAVTELVSSSCMEMMA